MQEEQQPQQEMVSETAMVKLWHHCNYQFLATVHCKLHFGCKLLFVLHRNLTNSVLGITCDCVSQLHKLVSDHICNTLTFSRCLMQEERPQAISQNPHGQALTQSML